AQPTNLTVDPLTLVLCSGDDVSCRRAGFRDDHVGLTSSLRAPVVGHPLRREQGVSEGSFDLFLTRQLGLDLLDLVAEIGALAPDLLEARDDLREELVGRFALVPERPAADLDVPNFDRRESHLESALR